jgi:hypothetical protein
MRRLVIAAALMLGLAGCGTLEYRGVQTDFNRAVAADNASIENPLYTPTAGYREVLEQLSPEAIAKLDPKLQPNAWMLRAVSAWRVGELAAASAAARAGSDLSPPPHSRDNIMLLSIRGLVPESEAMNAWQAIPRDERDKSDYDAIKDKFALAWTKLVAAEDQIGPATPRSVESYLHYQKWRVAANWAGVISGCGQCTPEERHQMHLAAKPALGGKEPQEAADAERDKVRGQLRDLIRAQGGG